LQDLRAACRWAWRHLLPLFGAIPDPARVARDGNIITGGGVTAGIDFGLVVVAEISGESFAQALQLKLEYAPALPFNAGRPQKRPARMSQMLPARFAAVQATAARLKVA
jgi:cyclohexyl-isocyanide hydratase